MLTIATMYEAKDKSNLKEYANFNRVLLETIPTTDIANRDKLNVTIENVIPSVKKLKWYYYHLLLTYEELKHRYTSKNIPIYKRFTTYL